MLLISLTAYSQYSPDFKHPTQPDVDLDSVVDYCDLDDDNDGLTDITEGCNDFDIEDTIGPDGTALVNGSSYVLNGTTVTYTFSGVFDKLESELLSPDHGFGIKAREGNGGVSEGDLTVSLSNPIDNLFFKLVDFDQDESWTVNVYDDTNTLIPLVDGNADGVFMRGQQVEQLAGHVFHDNTGGAGSIDPPTDSTGFDELNSVYFYFPNKLVSRIEFHILHPDTGSLRFIGMQYCQTDTDKDTISDDVDSDSDNDGIPDLVEAGGVDIDGNGITDDLTDTDADGFPDVYDLSISPWNYLTITGDCSGTTVNYNHIVSFPVSTSNANFDIGLTYCITGDYDQTGGSPSSREQFDLYIDDGAGGTTLVQAGVTPGGTDCSEACGSETISMALWNIANNDSLVELTFIPNNNVEGDSGANSCVDYSCLGEVAVQYNTTEIGGSSLADLDFDNDTLASRIDLDADGDGIVDLREIGENDTDNNGQIDGFTDVNSDGYHDGFDGAGGRLITGADTNGDGVPNSYPNKNPDNNGYPNHMDLDSDDDGITDNTEAQITEAYQAFGTIDSDSDGIADAFDILGTFGGKGLLTTDSDSDGTPDFLDLDSDDSEENDSVEGHDTNGDGVVDASDSPNADSGVFVGVDSDNDGLDNGFDNNDASFDPTNSSLQANSHPIFDAGSDRDWRSSQAAIDFDGINDHVDFGDNHDFTGAFSLEAWVLQETAVTTGTIISKGDAKAGVGNKRGYHLVLNNSQPNLIWYDNTGTVQMNIVSPYAISNNRWYHIAATYDGAIAKLYIDGVEVISGSSVNPPVNVNEKCILGASFDSDTPTVPKHYFDGYIDEVRIWNVNLSSDQIHEMMNQEIEQNGVYVKGKIIPLNISGGLSWNDLLGYYPMTNDNANDKSSNSKNGTPINITTVELQTAPLPYTTIRKGTWSDISSATPWLYGDSVWSGPNSLGIDGVTQINWNIVQTSHEVKSGDKNITVLGLISDAANKKIIIADPVEDQDETNSGQSLRITNYLELDGIIDLVGESQLLQDEGSILDQDSGGFLERDEQGTARGYNYNYWGSSVGAISSGIGTKGTGVSSINANYIISDILSDGTISATPQIINFQPAYTAADGAVTTPITISTYWLWKFNGLHDDYNSWVSINENSSLLAGEGYTMKGTSGLAEITTNQNYVFKGKPYNGDIVLPIALNTDRLVGNPYPSAIDADEFILDNINSGAGRASSNIINGALYFWDHFSGATHYLSEYVGGYATYTLMGGVKAISNDVRINNNGDIGTKVPERYITLNQGFFIIAALDSEVLNTTATVTGGDVTFKNSQRVFKTEVTDPSVSFKTANTTNSSIENDKKKFRLLIETPSGYYRQLLAGIDENATNNFDLGYDAPLIENNAEDGFWMFNESKFVIQAVNNFNVEQALPLGVKVAEGGLLKFSLDGLENIDVSQFIYLHDKETDVYRDLRVSDYEVNLSVGEYLNRFEIVFNNSVLDIMDNQLEDTIDVFYSNSENSIVINNPMQEKIESVRMFNVLGQSVYAFNVLSNNTNHKLETNGLSTGGYIINLKTSKGEFATKVLVK